MIAIDDQAASLLNADGTFSAEKFAAVNDDPALLGEFMVAGGTGAPRSAAVAATV